MNEFKLNYDDISIVPSDVTTIKSRAQCYPYLGDMGYETLPIFTSPMDTVINEDNWKKFFDRRVNPIIPRTVEPNDVLSRLRIGVKNKIFTAIGLQEANQLLSAKEISSEYKFIPNMNFTLFVCIDIANGHMLSLLNTIKALKEKFKEHIVIMSGNIANPEAYRQYEKAGCDFVRVGIGTGSACLTASNTGIYYPIFSLLEETYKIKKEMQGKCKIIADGGIKGYRDIQKALIFADYVMIGSLFNKAIESAENMLYGESYWNIRGKKIVRPLKTFFTFGKVIPAKKEYKAIKDFRAGKLSILKEYRGMSTKKSQRNYSKNEIKTSEGLIKYQNVEYDLAGWVSNEIDYLRSAMSYTNSRDLEEYKESQYAVNLTLKYNK